MLSTTTTLTLLSLVGAEGALSPTNASPLNLLNDNPAHVQQIDSFKKPALTKEQIVKTLQAARPRFQACYETAVKAQPGLAGKVDAAFTITPKGTVTQASIQNSTLKNEAMHACVLSELAQITFDPEPYAPVTLSYGWSFETTSRPFTETETVVVQPAAPPPPSALTSEQIDETLQSFRPQIQRCRADAAGEQLGAAAQIEVEFIIQTDGRVTDANVKSSTLGDEAVHTCILGVLGEVTFAPKPQFPVALGYEWSFAAVKAQEVQSLPATGFNDDFSRHFLGANYMADHLDWGISANGELYSSAHAPSPLWVSAVLPGDVQVEFDARSENPNADLECEIFGDGHTRGSGYILQLGASGEGTFSLARLDEHAPVVSGFASPLPNGGRVRVERLDRPLMKGHVYHWLIRRRGQTLSWQVDGQTIFEVTDPEPLRGEGHDRFAFGTRDANVFYDNLKVAAVR